MKLKILAAVALFAASSSAMAQNAPSPEMQAARDAMTKACAADAKTLCDGKTGRELNMCLRENTDKTSAPCKEAMSKMPAGGPPRPAN